MPEALDPVWRALSDPTRRRILDLLRERPRTTGEVCAAFPALSRHNVIKHLKVLEAVTLVRVEARGRERWNHLNAVPLQEVYERWLRPYEAEWAGRLWRLRRTVEARRDPMTDQQSARMVEVEQDVVLQAPPMRVFDALTNEIGKWWGSPYVASEDYRSLSLDLRPGGFFWEDWGDGQGIAVATVLGFRRGQILELEGTIRMTGAVSGTVTFELTPEGGGTRLHVRQRAVGAIPDEMAQMYREGWDDLLGNRLAQHLATARTPA